MEYVGEMFDGGLSGVSENIEMVLGSSRNQKKYYNCARESLKG